MRTRRLLRKLLLRTPSLGSRTTLQTIPQRSRKLPMASKFPTTLQPRAIVKTQSAENLALVSPQSHQHPPSRLPRNELWNLFLVDDRLEFFWVIGASRMKSIPETAMPYMAFWVIMTCSESSLFAKPETDDSSTATFHRELELFGSPTRKSTSRTIYKTSPVLKSRNTAGFASFRSTSTGTRSWTNLLLNGNQMREKP